MNETPPIIIPGTASAAPVTVWIAGRYTGDVAWAQLGNPADDSWEVLGIFTTEAAADARCVRTIDFYAPVVLDVAAPEERTDFPGVVWPRLK